MNNYICNISYKYWHVVFWPRSTEYLSELVLRIYANNTKTVHLKITLITTEIFIIHMEWKCVHVAKFQTKIKVIVTSVHLTNKAKLRILLKICLNSESNSRMSSCMNPPQLFCAYFMHLLSFNVTETSQCKWVTTVSELMHISKYFSSNQRM